jgi:hypothetical protein
VGFEDSVWESSAARGLALTWLQVLKHTPLAPKGTKFKWDDNKHIPRKPVLKGKVEPEKLRFEAIDSDGNIHERFFHKINEEKWNDGQWISDANKWRSQAIRRLFKADPHFKAKDIREKWTDEEIGYFKSNILSMAKKNHRQLVAKDWKQMVEMHNRKFFGCKAGAGGTPSNRVHGLRTATGLRTKYKRFPDLIAQVTQLIASPSEDTGDANAKSKDESE